MFAQFIQALFGFAVATDGARIVVATPYEKTGTIMTGAAYVYTRVDGTWTLETRLQGSNTTSRFGSAVTIDGDRVVLVCLLPLNEILVDFNDRMKSITRGYGSMDYELGEYVTSDLVKMDIRVNEEPVDAFSSIVHASKAEGRGRALCEKLKDLLPRQLFKIAIQAAIGSKVIARETIGSVGKDVTAKCYGGDISRKRKLLDKQKEGKKRMKQIGKVDIPQEAFIKILKNED